jgi:glycosyltransferase involved in cell wall biosynthesis
MAAGKPIVLAVDGEARETLERSGGGIAVPPGDAGALAGAVRRFAGDAALRESTGRAGSVFVEREFGRRAWAGRYLQILDQAREAGVEAVAPQPDTSTPF